MSHYEGETKINASQKAYERHAWIILLASGIGGVIFALNFLIVGVPPDAKLVKSVTGSTWDELMASSPGATTFLRTETYKALGMIEIGSAIYAMAMAAVPFRRGEKWAWYISWYNPAFFIALTTNNLSLGGRAWPLYIIFLILSSLGLLLPYRNFFLLRNSH